ncbi:MAG: hypothetical protein ACREXR_08735 [Gammaproteobacteria bacterium]
MFDAHLTQPYLDNRCLTFLILEGAEPGVDDEFVSRRVAQTYSLETGLVHWPDPVIRESQPTVSLRENSRLSTWEPMTSSKFALMALERGIAGEGIETPGRITHPEMAAITVSPQGFVFCWDANEVLAVSDVGRLANVHEPMTKRGGDGWSRYVTRSREVLGPGDGHIPPDRAWVGNDRTPRPMHPEDLTVDTLAHCGMFAASLIEESGNDIFGDYSPQAAVFIQRQFGVDVNAVDCQAGNQARLISQKFSRSTPFDPVTARTALRLAVLNSKVQRTAPTAITQALSQDAATRVQRLLPPRPTQ